MKRIRYLFKHLYVRVTLLIIGLVLPFNLFAVILQEKVIDGLEEQANIVLQNLLNGCANDLSVRSENTNGVLNRYVTNDEYCIRMSRCRGKNAEYLVNRMHFIYSLKQVGSMIHGADGYFFYFKEADDMIAYCDNSSEEYMRRSIEQELGRNIKDEFDRGWLLCEYNGVEYLILKIDYSGVICGGWINLDKVKRDFEKSIEYEKYMLDFGEREEKPVPGSNIYLSANSGKIYLNFSMDRQEILGLVVYQQKIQYVIVYLMFLVCPVLCLSLRRILLKPLFVLQEAHRNLQMDPDRRIREQANSAEYEFLYESFNDMADNLNRLKIESYEKEIERCKMELRNLRIQMQPHFLLNTFDLMFKLTQRKEEDAVQEVILYLSDYFRYVFRNDRELDLFFKERRLIEAYVNTVRLRFRQKVELECSVEPEIDYVRIPPLLIHNFVENCVKHGLCSERTLHITITGSYENQRVTFEIIDDGKGFEEKNLNWQKQIISGEEKPDNPNEHVGLLNSMKRLKFYYGEGARIEIESVTNEWTCFTISFPYNMEIENESIDCE